MKDPKYCIGEILLLINDWSNADLLKVKIIGINIRIDSVNYICKSVNHVFNDDDSSNEIQADEDHIWRSLEEAKEECKKVIIKWQKEDLAVIEKATIANNVR